MSTSGIDRLLDLGASNLPHRLPVSSSGNEAMTLAPAGPTPGEQLHLPSGEASLYGQFCPLAMAAELLATRWTMVVLGEMLSGSTRFNEIRHGVPRMSTALLSKRLRELAHA